MRGWTEKELARLTAGGRRIVDTSAPPFKLPPNEPGGFALGRLPAGQMNKTETAYANHLEMEKRSGDIIWYKFEGIKLRLADSTFYTPDFFVMLADRSLRCDEVKGFMQDDANVKIKVAASIYPFKFVIVRKRKGGWEFEEK